jgi:hypothetical protein
VTNLWPTIGHVMFFLAIRVDAANGREKRWEALKSECWLLVSVLLNIQSSTYVALGYILK